MACLTTTEPSLAVQRNGTTQNLTNQVWTKVDWDASLSNDRWTPGTAGYYRMEVILEIDGLAEDLLFQVALYKNGTKIFRTYVRGAGNLTTSIAFAPPPVLVDTDDYFEIFAYQSSGATKALTTDSTRGQWSARRVHA